MTDSRKPPAQYTREERETGLFALAVANGNARRASRELDQSEVGRIPESTLRTWQRRHRDVYERVQTRVLPEIQERMAEQMEALFTAQAEVEWELLAKLREELPNLKASEAASALRNLGVTKALNVDKSGVIRGRPTQIHEHRSYEDLIKKLEDRGVLTVEAEAVEVAE